MNTLLYFAIVVFAVYLIYIVFTQPRAAVVLMGILWTIMYGVYKIFEILFRAIYKFLGFLLRWK